MQCYATSLCYVWCYIIVLFNWHHALYKVRTCATRSIRSYQPSVLHTTCCIAHIMLHDTVVVTVDYTSHMLHLAGYVWRFRSGKHLSCPQIAGRPRKSAGKLATCWKLPNITDDVSIGVVSVRDINSSAFLAPGFSPCAGRCTKRTCCVARLVASQRLEGDSQVRTRRQCQTEALGG